MNLYEDLNDIFPFLISIRKLENYISIDVEFPVSWKLPKKYVDEKAVLEQKTSRQDFRCFSFATNFEEVALTNSFNNLRGIINYNLEREEKERLFEMKVKELKTLFEKASLDELKELAFQVKPEFKLIDSEYEDERQGENSRMANIRN
jgi:hypothetical protein